MQAAQLHDLPLARQCGNRETIAYALAEGRKVRRNSVEFLCARDVPAKAGDHFIENEHGAFAAAELLNRAEKIGLRADGRRGLQDDAGNSAGILDEEGAEVLDVVVSELK